MNALLVDDERLARKELRRLLSAHPDVTVVGEAANPSMTPRRVSASCPSTCCFSTSRCRAPQDSICSNGSIACRCSCSRRRTTSSRCARSRSTPATTCSSRSVPTASRPRSTRCGPCGRPHARPPRPAPAGPRLRAAADRVFLRDGDRCWIVTMAEIAVLRRRGQLRARPLRREPSAASDLAQCARGPHRPALFFRASRRHLINLRFVERIDAGVDDAYTVRLRGGHSVDRIAAAIARDCARA